MIMQGYPMKTIKKNIAGQPSFLLRNDDTELAITQLGGHMAPITFYRSSTTPIKPYYMSPWQKEKIAIDEPVLKPLRGDFFCMPFGGNNHYRNEKHVAHGETATSKWSLLGTERNGTVSTLSLQMKTKVRPGSVTKKISLVDGHNAIDCQHILDGYSGKMCLGHHATLHIPDEPESLHFSCSPFRFGYTAPSSPGPYANNEYFSLPPSVVFKKLEKVPTLWSKNTVSNRTVFPCHDGFTDILAVFPKSAKTPAWNAAVFPHHGYAWYTLKDPLILTSTVLWMSNKGRHGSPWNGRNRCLGVEDVTAFFAQGLKESAQRNFLNDKGVETVVHLNEKKITLINYIQGVVRIPAGFKRIQNILPTEKGICLLDIAGNRINTPLNVSFLKDGSLHT